MVFTWTYKNKEKKVKRKELLIVKARKSVLEMLKGVFQKKKRKKKGHCRRLDVVNKSKIRCQSNIKIEGDDV